MTDKLLYIFRSGELFLLEGSVLPHEIPQSISSRVVDSFDLVLDGKPSTAVLVGDESCGRSGAAGCSPASLSTPAGDADMPGSWIKLRLIMASADPRIAALAPSATRALGLVNWHHSAKFCSRCGASLVDSGKEIARLCSSCSSVYYPRLSPAIIVLVKKGAQVLLARHSYRNQDLFTCLAGFLEHGETLEQCVAREVFEETHLEIDNIRYVGSQSWPFPDQYMLAFLADWKAGDIRVDPAEILEARWFDRDRLPETPMAGTVAWNLIHGVFDLC